MMKKVVSVLLMIVLVLSFAACGKTSTDETQYDITETGNSSVEPVTVSIPDVDYEFNCGEKDPNARYFGTNAAYDVFVNEKQTVDPADLYSSIKYDESFFKGTYVADVDDVRGTAIYNTEKEKWNLISIQGSDPEKYMVNALPVGFAFQSKYEAIGTIGDVNYDFLNASTDLSWASVKYITETDEIDIPSVIEISGNKITITDALVEKSHEYELGKSVTYTFEFCGPYLTLKSDAGSVELKSKIFNDDASVVSYSQPDSELIGNVDYFDCHYKSVARKRDGKCYSTVDIKLCENGLAYIKLVEPDANGNAKVIDKQCVYIASGKHEAIDYLSLIFIDKEGVYYYNENSTERQVRLNNGQKFTSEEAVLVENLYSELEAEFAKKNINVTIDRANGELALDASVIFKGDSSELTEEGKKLISDFADTYYPLSAKSEYSGFIKGIKVEGHTAPLSGSTYESGLPLSTERAEKVKTFLDETASAKYDAGSIEAVGCSNMRPVYTPEGEYDLDACRRVAFRILFNTESE